MAYLNEHKLNELIKVTRGASLSGEYYGEEGELIRLTLGNFDYINGGFKENSSKDNIYYNGPVADNYIMNKGDIITPLTEQTPGLLGTTARIPNGGKYIQSQDVGLVTCFEDKIDKDFCYYLLPTKIVKMQLSNGAQQTKIRHTSPDKIEGCTVFVPRLKEQRKIGKLLSNIDKFIDLKRKENTILESIAKQIYDYWFVQFDFPNEEGKPYKSSGGKMVWNETLKREIPEGWNDAQLGDVLICNNESTTQGKHLEGLPYCPIDEIPIRKMSFAGGKNWNEANSSLQLYKKKDILIGAMRVYFHRCCIAAENGITRTTTLVLKPYDKELLGYFYQICNEERAFSYANRVSSGTQQPYVTWNSLAKYYFPYPNNPSLIRKYSKKVDTIIDLVIANVKEINALQSLRDYLLPLLMNGQVTIKD